MFFRISIVLSVTLAFAMAALPLHAQTTPATVATIKAALQSYPKNIRSLSCKITTTTTLDGFFVQDNNIPEGAVDPVQVEEGEWAFKGDRIINKSKHTEGEAVMAGHDMAEDYLFDGTSSYQIRSESGGAATRSVYGNRQHQSNASAHWNPLHFGYQLNGRWWSDVLDGNAPTLERVGLDPTFGQLYVIHLSLPGREERVWFAPKYGNIAVKIVENTPHDSAVYTSSHYKRYGNFWIPLQGDFRILTKQPDGRTLVQVDKSFVFSDIQVNTVPDKTFDFHWPTGAALYDNDTRTKYFRDASGNWVKRMDIAEEIAHTPNRVSAADFAPWVLLVSLATLFTLGYLRWRRRASA